MGHTKAYRKQINKRDLTVKKRLLGNSKLELSTIGLGTWAIGGAGWAFGWGAQEEQDSIATIHRALDLGINWIDTAAAYGFGRSEISVGKALKGRNDDIILATKCGIIRDDSGKLKRWIKADSIIEECNASLTRLKRETIDLYQIHWPDPPEDIDEAFLALLKLKDQGKIRYAAVSNFSAAQLEQVAKHGPITSLQSPYSLLKRDIEANELPWCQAHNCGVLAYSPMQCGLLTGKVTEEWVKNLPSDDWRKRKNKLFQQPELGRILTFVDKLKDIAASSGHTAAQLAIAWTLQHSAVTSAIVGARRPEQIEETVKAADWKFSDAERAGIGEALGELENGRVAT